MNRQFTPCISAIAITSLVIYFFQILPFSGSFIFENFSLIPSTVLFHGELWRLLTYAFLHDPTSPFHLVFNMLTLWMFGTELEKLWGSRKFSIFYVSTALLSGVISLATLFLGNPPIIGASGAVLAVLTAYAILFPDRQLLMFFIIPVPVRFAVVIFGVISIFGSITGSGGIAHLTHLGGILAGFAFVKWEPFFLTQYNSIVSQRAHAQMKKRSAAKISRDIFFAESIDPILQKISATGLDSLTKAERKILESFKATSSSSTPPRTDNIIKGRFGSR